MAIHPGFPADGASRLRKGDAALFAPLGARPYASSNTASISTATPIGSELMPTALRAPTP